MSVLKIHGTADQVVAYAGARSFVEGWVRRDGCAPVASPTAVATRTTLFDWSLCSGGTEVAQDRIRNGRNQWPRATPPDPGPPATICTVGTIGSFFSTQPVGSRTWSTSGGAGLTR